MLIKEFYKNKEIFITGGSGFIGKALIEKLLRSCPDIAKIFVLIRGKKGKNADERLNEIFNQALFKRLRKEQPLALKKIFAIDGDCAKLNLGIKAEDLVKLQNVNVIFHAAANVRFDDDLLGAVLLNIRGTHELIKIAENFKNLQAFVHVSTTYCNPDKKIVEEKIYDTFADWRTTIKLAETYSIETLNIFSLKYSKYQPNTYTFTKGLAEQIINDYRSKLPVVIFRPSIVISSLMEPLPGWIDNFNGPIGLLVACGVGIMRTNYADPDIVSDYVPVDIVIRSLLITAYKIGKEQFNKTDVLERELEIINCATSEIFQISTGEIIETGKRMIRKNPFEKTLYVPGGTITRCWTWNLIRFITMHILMALILDTILRFANQKPFLLKLQRKIYAANIALYYFLTTRWIFKNSNFLNLDAQVPTSEIDEFAFMQYTNLDVEEFLSIGIRGAKEFLLKESPDSSPAARFRLKVFIVIDTLIKLIGIFYIARFGYRYLQTIMC